MSFKKGLLVKLVMEMVLVGCLLVNCSSSKNELKKALKNAKTITDNQFGYSLKIPKSWNEVKREKLYAEISEMVDSFDFFEEMYSTESEKAIIEQEKYYYNPRIEGDVLKILVLKVPDILANVTIREIVEVNNQVLEHQRGFTMNFDTLNGKEFFYIASYDSDLCVIAAATLNNGYLYIFLSSSIGEDVAFAPMIISTIKIK